MNPVIGLACCAVLLFGCRADESFCPDATVEVNPVVIPTGDNDSLVTVTIDNPNPDNGREVLTELYAESGTFNNPVALRTTYNCAHDVSGEVEICVDVIYGPPIGPAPSGSASEAIDAALEYLRAPTAYFIRPEDCLETSCTTVVCPEDKNLCPVINDFTVQPEVIMEDEETATVRVVAQDPDNNPAPLVTTLVAKAGSFDDRHAMEATYTCDPGIGGPIEICVEASDGDSSCDVFECLTVQCPGPIPDNVCPVIRDLTSTPKLIPPGFDQALIEVNAFDPDAVNPEPLVTTLSASLGVFGDKNARETIYTCGSPGPAEICVKASDGDRDCDEDRCITVQCPGTVPDNICPRAFVINAIPSNTIAAGQDWTEVHFQADDPDAPRPLPLTTTFRARRGTFDDPNAANTIYRCERGGLIEICADATDGACEKTLCMDVICPAQ
jgi:hypothetical protein